MNPSKKLRILVADDEQGVRDLIAYLLEPLGYAVFTARDGKEAVEIIEHEEFDVIFLDVHMPRMRGVEALSEIRRRLPQQKVIIFSSSSDPFYVFESQAKQKGATDCLYKPFELDDLLLVINKTMKAS